VRQTLSSLLLLSLGACANVPLASPQDDQEAKRFDLPPPEKGALYVYRQGWFGVARPVDVAIAGGAQAQLASNTYFRLEGPPGPVEVSCRTGDKSDSRQVEMAPGQTRYLEVAMRAGWWGPTCEVSEVPPQQGQAAVRAGKRVEAL
jgi:hypothetical protein